MTQRKTSKARGSSASADNRLIARVVLLLLLAASLILSTRLLTGDEHQLPGGDSSWQVRFSAQAKVKHAGEILVAPVQNTDYARVYGQSIFHPALRQKRNSKKSHTRDIVLVSNQPGSYAFSVTFDIHLSQLSRPLAKKRIRENEREIWLVDAVGIFVDSAGVVEILAEMNEPDPAAQEVARYLFEYVSERISLVNEGSDDGAMALELRAGSKLGMTRALVSLFRSAHLPARMVTGVDLTTGRSEHPHHWLEVYYDERWHVIDVVRGNYDFLPRGLLPVIRGSEHIVRVNDGDSVALTIHSNQASAPANAQLPQSGSIWQIFNLSRISPDGREALALLLLLPIGILATEFFRQFIGIRTFGTFTPTLLALAAVYVDIKTASVIFALVILFGVAGRALLPKIRFSRVARLSIVFTMVAGIMVFAVSALLFFDPGIDSAVVLLPIVVLTSLVDRFYSVADEVGAGVAIKRLVWTIVVAAVSLVVLVQDSLGQGLLQYPELHLLTIAVIILFGRYQRLRLADLASFRWIAEPAISAKKTLSSESEI